MGAAEGKERAGYGKRVLERLAERLQAEFGKGFDQSNLRNMRAFFVIYPIRDALRHELSWTHYRFLLRVDNPATLTCSIIIYLILTYYF